MKSIRNIILEDAKHCQEKARRELTGKLPPPILEFSMDQILSDAKYFANAFPIDAVPVSRASMRQLLDLVMKMSILTDTDKQVLMALQRSLDDDEGVMTEVN